MAKVLVDLLQGGHYAFLEELPQRTYVCKQHSEEKEYCIETQDSAYRR